MSTLILEIRFVQISFAICMISKMGATLWFIVDSGRGLSVMLVGKLGRCIVRRSTMDSVVIKQKLHLYLSF